MPEPIDGMIRCPECSRVFQVVWLNDGLGPPEVCPMCGAEVDYEVEESDRQPEEEQTQ